MAKLITTLPKEPFHKWGLDFIGFVKLMSRYFSNQYILVVAIYITSGWKQELYTPIQLLLP
jgi:hypothetical protein